MGRVPILFSWLASTPRFETSPQANVFHRFCIYTLRINSHILPRKHFGNESIPVAQSPNTVHGKKSKRILTASLLAIVLKASSFPLRTLDPSQVIVYPPIANPRSVKSTMDSEQAHYIRCRCSCHSNETYVTALSCIPFMSEWHVHPGSATPVYASTRARTSYLVPSARVLQLRWTTSQVLAGEWTKYTSSTQSSAVARFEGTKPMVHLGPPHPVVRPRAQSSQRTLPAAEVRS